MKPAAKSGAATKQGAAKKPATSSNRIATKNVGKPQAKRAVVKNLAAKKAVAFKTAAVEADAPTAPNASADLST